MFCPKCGAKLQDGSSFCSSCGSKLNEKSVTNSVQDSTEKSRNTFVKKINIKKLIPVIAVVIIIVVAGLLVKFFLNFGTSKDNAYVYFSGSDYEVLTNLKKKNAAKLDASGIDEVYSNYVRFSEDGKYVYYISKYNSEIYTGTLCRAEYGKLKANSEKNNKYIKIIASNVKEGYTLLPDNKVVYENGDSNLYLYDGNENIQISQAVNWHSCDDKNNIVYETGNYDEGYNMYQASLSDIKNKTELVTDYARILNYQDLNNIIYVDRDEDERDIVYTVGIDKGPQKLGENAYPIFLNEEEYFYTVDSDKSLSLYDYVVDDYAEDDKNLKKPDEEDYAVQEYSYQMIKGNSVKESDYDVLYTSCIRELYWYGESTWWSRSMENALKEDWGDNTEKVYTATQNFIDKYGKTADENGFIVVTEEVKEALKEIAKTEGDEFEDKWIWLCYSREKAGKRYDYDSYDAACEYYAEAQERIELRKNLQDPESNYAVKDLYYSKNGESTLISNSVLSTSNSVGLLMFNTVDMIEDKVDITQITSTSEVTELFAINSGEKNYFVSSYNTTPIRFSEEVAEILEEASGNGYVELYATDSMLAVNTFRKELFIADIAKETVGELSNISEDAAVVKVDSDVVYYVSNVYSENIDNCYGDLYKYCKGESECVMQDVVLHDINKYEDGMILAYTGINSFYEYELTSFDEKGKTTIVSDGVTQYIRISDKVLLYISDGDLYYYDGKNSNLISKDVERVWSKASMKVKNTFNYYE